jgi:nitrogen fixation NifU-like protein
MTQPTPQLDELYREVIIDHFRRPRHHGDLAGEARRFEGMNPVCGDEVEIAVRLEDGRIDGIAFRGQGCAISQASASMMAVRLAGAPLEDAHGVIGRFRAMMVEGAEPGPDFGDLEALQGVAKYPVRVKCALLCWNVLQQGLAQIDAQTDDNSSEATDG